MERPILFSGEMVRAILDGRKTQTRRVVDLNKLPKWKFDIEQDNKSGNYNLYYEDGYGNHYEYCKYGKPGGELWVKETAWVCTDNNDKIRYVADGPAPTTENRHYKKRASLFMSRLESRISLVVKNIRVERVQDITEEDAIREGTRCWICGGMVDGMSEEDCTCFHTKKEAIPSFQVLWDSINEPRGFGWNVNPWVWVIEFERKG